MDVTHSLTTPVPQEVSDQEIQMRAYLRWEAAGKPRGNDFRFWVEAREDLQREKGALETIRQRAHAKWEAAGKPKSKHSRFWVEAKDELQRGE